MKTFLLTVAACGFLLTGTAKEPLYRDSSAPLAERVDDLLSRMTLREKLGQLSQPLYRSDDTTLDARITRGEVGSLVVAHGSALAPAERDRLQRIAVERSRLGIPVLFGFDVIHGYRTLFPIPLGIAASWNPELAEASARIAASEASACGIDLTFSPMVDVARDPRWGRISEGSGEDVLLNAVSVRLSSVAIRATIPRSRAGSGPVSSISSATAPHWAAGTISLPSCRSALCAKPICRLSRHVSMPVR